MDPVAVEQCGAPNPESAGTMQTYHYLLQTMLAILFHQLSLLSPIDPLATN